MTDRRIPLKVVIAPSVGVVLEAPPVLKASEHSVDYTCGRCSTALLHADEGQVHAAAQLASRLSVNLEGPSDAVVRRLAREKDLSKHFKRTLV